MPVLPISHPGVTFHVFSLKGTLRYTITRHGKPAREHELTEHDFQDNDAVVQDISAVNSGLGVDASAVGVQLRVIKNDGVLGVVFEGRGGGCAEWRFDGLGGVVGRSRVASAAVQTDGRAEMCLACGVERLEWGVVSVRGSGMQVRKRDTRNAGTQMDAKRSERSNLPYEAGTDKAPEGIVREESTGLKVEDIDESEVQISSLISTGIQTELGEKPGSTYDLQQINNAIGTPSRELKRKAQTTPDDRSTPHKRAKSAHDSTPWPQHLYMECYRTTPIFKGDVGRLHIDLQEGKVWFEGWYGKPHMRVYEEKQINLRDEYMAVSYQQYVFDVENCPRKGFEGATHYLVVSKPSTTYLFPVQLRVDCGLPDWMMWGVESDGSKTSITDPSIVVDALVHCIDRTSGRDAVHDPDRDAELRQRLDNYDTLRDLDDEQIKSRRKAVKEMERREHIRDAMRQFESSPVDESSEGDLIEPESSVDQTTSEDEDEMNVVQKPRRSRRFCVGAEEDS